MKLVTLPVGSLGVDTDTVLQDEDVDAIVDTGYAFVIRYLSLGHQAATDLQPDERDRILKKLALGVVQHVKFPGWEPTFDLGNQLGGNAASNASQLVLPTGAILWCDLEGTEGGNPMGFCEAWSGRVREISSYVPGVYVGDQAGLDAKALGALRQIHNYWRSLSRVPEPYPRGWQLMQLSTGGKPIVVGRVSVDVNVVQADFFGNLPTWVAAD